MTDERSTSRRLLHRSSGQRYSSPEPSPLGTDWDCPSCFLSISGRCLSWRPRQGVHYLWRGPVCTYCSAETDELILFACPPCRLAPFARWSRDRLGRTRRRSLPPPPTYTTMRTDTLFPSNTAAFSIPLPLSETSGWYGEEDMTFLRLFLSLPCCFPPTVDAFHFAFSNLSTPMFSSLGVYSSTRFDCFTQLEGRRGRKGWPMPLFSCRPLQPTPSLPLLFGPLHPSTYSPTLLSFLLSFFLSPLPAYLTLVRTRTRCPPSRSPRRPDRPKLPTPSRPRPRWKQRRSTRSCLASSSSCVSCPSLPRVQASRERRH